MSLKNYSTYQKSRPVYFSGELIFPLGLLLISSIITYGLLYVFGVTIALLFNLIISWCAYFYLYYYGKSDVSITFDFIIGVVIILSVLLFFDYGVYSLVIFQKTSVFNRFYFLLWLGVLLGTPVFYYAFQYGRFYFFERKMAVNYLKVVLDIDHDRELLTYIDEVQFLNTLKKQSSDIKLEKPPCFYSEQELKEMENSSTRNYHIEKSVYSEVIHIPFGANQLKMSWYSIIEDTYYDIELPFSFDKMIIEKQKYPTNIPSLFRGKKTKSLTLHIYAHGGVRLFNNDTILINHTKSDSTKITPELRDQKIRQHQYSHQFYNDSKRFLNLIEKIKNKGGIEERFLIQNKLLCWGMNISGLEEKNYLEVTDVAFAEYKSEINDLEGSALRFLPNKIEIIFRGHHLYRWLILRINTQKLYHCIQNSTNKNEKTPVSFDLVFENYDQTDLKFMISSNEKSFEFTDWEIQIDKARKQSMAEYLQEKSEDETKRNLLKEAWDLVANKQYDLAHEKCDTIKSIDQSYGFAYFLEARLLWYKEGFEACYAKRDYFIAKTKHEPSALAHIYNSYGCLLDQELDYKESIIYFEKAITTNPNEGMYVCNLAEMYCKLKESKKAMHFAKKAKKLGHQSAILNSILESNGTYNFAN